MCRLRNDPGGVLYPDRTACQGDADESGSARVDCVFVLVFWNRYIRGTCKKSTYLWLGIVCAVTLAVYLYRMINCFPGAPPMVYHRNNILRRLL